MTREEFKRIYTWRELYESMRAQEYYVDMEEYFYGTPEEFRAGLIHALTDVGCSFEDIAYMDLSWIDPTAEVWTASIYFSTIRNHYGDEFQSIKDNFEEWLEGNGYFDEEDDCEIESAPDNAADMQRVSDDALDMLLFGA